MDEILEYMQEILGFSNQTRTGYINSLKKYSEFHNMTLEELIEEAEEDEDNAVKKRKRRINKRIIDFKNHLCETTYKNPINGKEGQYSPLTIKTYLKDIKSFYNVYDIDVPKIRNLPTEQKEGFDDTISKDMIKSVLRNTTNLKHKVIFLALASSGIDSDTLRKITWNDFFKASEEYHNWGTPQMILKTLKENGEVIPLFHSTRGKTNYEHIFFFSPETVEAICTYGLSLKTIDENKSIVNMGRAGLTKVFSRANDRLNYGLTSAGTRRKFHAHGLRSYFATQLIGTSVDGMMVDSLMIEFMLGHSIPATTAAYYKKNSKVLKDTYTKILPKLAIEEVNVRDINSPEYKQLEKQLEKLQGLGERMDELEKLKSLFDSELNK